MTGVVAVGRGGSRFEDVDFDKSEARRAALDSLIAEVGKGELTPTLQLASATADDTSPRDRGLGGMAFRLATAERAGHEAVMGMLAMGHGGSWLRDVPFSRQKAGRVMAEERRVGFGGVFVEERVVGWDLPYLSRIQQPERA